MHPEATLGVARTFFEQERQAIIDSEASNALEFHILINDKVRRCRVLHDDYSRIQFIVSVAPIFSSQEKTKRFFAAVTAYSKNDAFSGAMGEYEQSICWSMESSTVSYEKAMAEIFEGILLYAEAYVPVLDVAYDATMAGCSEMETLRFIRTLSIAKGSA